MSHDVLHVCTPTPRRDTGLATAGRAALYALATPSRYFREMIIAARCRRIDVGRASPDAIYRFTTLLPRDFLFLSLPLKRASRLKYT